MSDEKTRRLIVETTMEKHVEEYHTEKEHESMWYEVVPHEDKKLFLQTEHEYVYQEELLFYAASTDEEIEECREKVLNKRKIFLQKYINGEIQLNVFFNNNNKKLN